MHLSVTCARWVHPPSASHWCCNSVGGQTATGQCGGRAVRGAARQPPCAHLLSIGELITLVSAIVYFIYDGGCGWRRPLSEVVRVSDGWCCTSFDDRMNATGCCQILLCETHRLQTLIKDPSGARYSIVRQRRRYDQMPTD